MVGLAVQGAGAIGLAFGGERPPVRVGPRRSVLGGLDQILFGKLETFGHALSGLHQGSLHRVELLVAGPTSDRRGLPRCGVDLGLLPITVR